MKTLLQTVLISSVLIAAPGSADNHSGDESLKMTALNALMSAPAERALPILRKVFEGDGSLALKKRALFVLSQVGGAEAEALLLEMARNGEPAMRHEAIRAIGIGGSDAALQAIGDLYGDGDAEVREAILGAYLIAGNAQGVYEIAVNASDPDEFERAVSKLGAMGATEELRQLRSRVEMADTLINAFAIAGDIESLTELARQAPEPAQQARAIQALGITGDDEVVPLLRELYANNASPAIREAVRGAMLVGSFDDLALDLYRNSGDAAEKRELLQLLVMMDSDRAWEVINEALEEDE